MSGIITAQTPKYDNITEWKKTTISDLQARKDKGFKHFKHVIENGAVEQAAFHAPQPYIPETAETGQKASLPDHLRVKAQSIIGDDVIALFKTPAAKPAAPVKLELVDVATTTHNVSPTAKTKEESLVTV